MAANISTQILKLSPPVARQFQNHYEFKSGAPETTGMLFGSIDTARKSQVHYAPPFLPQISPSLKLHDYAYGRYEASTEAAYHLCGWVGLGYWLAYQGHELSPELLLTILNGSMGGEMPLPDRLLLTVRWASVGSIELRAYTYGESSPPIDWRELILINAESANERFRRNI
ncbi:hypothetical protein [Deinococcus sp. UYEF24]